MTKKILLTAALTAGLASTALADGPKLTIGGMMDSTAGYVRNAGIVTAGGQTAYFDKKDPSDMTSGELQKYSLVNDAYLYFNADAEAANGLKYGGQIITHAAAAVRNDPSFTRSRSNASSLYAKGMFGCFKLGNMYGVGHDFIVNTKNFAASTALNDVREWWNDKDGSGRQLINSFITSPHLYTDISLFDHTKRAISSKISYEMPEMSGFTLGISYIPDLLFINNAAANSTVGGYDHIVQGGLKYEGSFDNIAVMASVVGEHGDSKEEAKQHNLLSWETGLNVSMMGFTVGGSYGSHEKSDLLKPTITSGTVEKKGRYWTAGAAYDFGMGMISATYFTSEKGLTQAGTVAANDFKQNKFGVFTIGVDYKLAPGFMPYVEYANFQMDDYYNRGGGSVDAHQGLVKQPSNKGYVLLLGTRLAF